MHARGRSFGGGPFASGRLAHEEHRYTRGWKRCRTAAAMIRLRIVARWLAARAVALCRVVCRRQRFQPRGPPLRAIADTLRIHGRASVAPMRWGLPPCAGQCPAQGSPCQSIGGGDDVLRQRPCGVPPGVASGRGRLGKTHHQAMRRGGWEERGMTRVTAGAPRQRHVCHTCGRARADATRALCSQAGYCGKRPRRCPLPSSRRGRSSTARKAPSDRWRRRPR